MSADRDPPSSHAGDYICNADLKHEMDLELARSGYADYEVSIPFPEAAQRALTDFANKHFRVVRRKDPT